MMMPFDKLFTTGTDSTSLNAPTTQIVERTFTQAEVDAKVASAEEATVLACAEHIPWSDGKCTCGVKYATVDSLRPFEDFRDHIRALLKTPGQLARREASVTNETHLVWLKALGDLGIDISGTLSPDGIHEAMKEQLADREDEIRRKEAQWWDTYIDEHLEKYGKEWRRKRGKERLAKLVSAHES